MFLAVMRKEGRIAAVRYWHLWICVEATGEISLFVHTQDFQSARNTEEAVLGAFG
jgi:hypothetical protein